MLKELGVNPLKDVETVTVATSGNTRADLKYLVIARGKFDREKIHEAAEARAKKDGTTFTATKDGNSVTFTYKPVGGPPVYGVVVDDGTAVIASGKKLIRDSLAAATAKTPAPMRKELADLVKKIDDKAAVAVASLVRGKLGDLNLPANLPFDVSGLEKMLSRAETLAVTLHAATDVDVVVTFGMEDDKEAAEMLKTLNKLLADLKPLAKLAGAAEPRAKPLSEILDTIKTASKNKDVTVTGKVTGANIGTMLKPND